MREITILSGKGGAGKTSVTAALASLAGNAVFCDNDVDASDLHLILHPDIKQEYQFDSGTKASIDPDICTGCRLCIKYCRFDAIHYDYTGQLEINPFQCEGCRLCERICPVNAITSYNNTNNKWYISDTRFGPMVHARMGPGEENSGKLVTKIREKAREMASELNADFIISDGSPGIGCPVIASITGTDIVLLVVEPSLTGIHDAGRLYKLVKSFNIPAFGIINKFDINEEITNMAELFLQNNNIPLIAKIPFDTRVVESMVHGKTIFEYAPAAEMCNQFEKAWTEISKF